MIALLATRTDPQALVIRLHRVPFMDITGIQVLAEVADKLRRRGVRVVLCEANTRVLAKLRKAHVVAGSADGYADRLGDALRLILSPAIRPDH